MSYILSLTAVTDLAFCKNTPSSLYCVIFKSSTAGLCWWCYRNHHEDYVPLFYQITEIDMLQFILPLFASSTCSEMSIYEDGINRLATNQFIMSQGPMTANCAISHEVFFNRARWVSWNLLLITIAHCKCKLRSRGNKQLIDSLLNITNNIIPARLPDFVYNQRCTYTCTMMILCCSNKPKEKCDYCVISYILYQRCTS